MDDAIEALLNEARMLFHRAVQVGQELHARESATLGMRAVLEYLRRHGPAPVPEIARRRFVTRQHIQALVNDLLEQGLVALAPNEAHRRSSLVTLLPAGERLIDRMRTREARLYARIGAGLRRQEIEAAARTLADLREALGGGS